jgi:N-acetylglutamate synthase-like GNAT family acetyltransferase
MSAFIIRKYEAEDYIPCRALWRELTEWHRQIYEAPTIGGDTPEDAFDKHLAKVGMERLWVAVHGSVVVGFVGLIVEEHEAEVELLIISQHYRCRGIGTQLLDTVLTEARKLSIRYLNARPVASNIDALHFFHQYGFDTIGHIQLFIDLKHRPRKPGIEIHNQQFNY